MSKKRRDFSKKKEKRGISNLSLHVEIQSFEMIDEDGLDDGEEDEEEDKEDRGNVCSIDSNLSDRSPRNEDDSGRSVTTIISEKIRSKLPSISQRFKGLLRSIGTRHQTEEADATITEENSSRSLVELDGTSPISSSSETTSHATISHEGDLREGSSIDLSTSSMYTAEDEESSIYSAGRIVSFADRTLARIHDSQRLTRMVSNSMNTVEISGDLNLGNIISDGVIITENPMELAAILSIPLGLPEIREPRNVPLGFDPDEIQNETYFDESLNGESSFTESSTMGSEVSSYTDVEVSERRDQATGQDNELPVPIYNPRILTVIRKPFYRRDDEPSIY